MREQDSGRIINMASVSGHTMIGGLADYQTAKAAMLGFSKSIAIDLAPPWWPSLLSIGLHYGECLS